MSSYPAGFTAMERGLEVRYENWEFSLVTGNRTRVQHIIVWIPGVQVYCKTVSLPGPVNYYKIITGS